MSTAYVIRPRVLMGMRHWFDRAAPPVLLSTRDGRARNVVPASSLPEQPIVWWLPDGSLSPERPADEHAAYYATPVRAIRIERED